MAIVMDSVQREKISVSRTRTWREKQLAEFQEAIDSVSTNTLNHILGREIADILKRMRAGEELLDGQKRLMQCVVIAIERARAG